MNVEPYRDEQLPERFLRWIERLRAALRAMPQYPYTPDFTAPTLLNSWVNYGSGWATAGYSKDPLGRVHLRGLVKNGSSLTAVILTLPADHRPSASLTFATLSNDVLCRLNVEPTGNVVVVSGGSTAWVSLNGVSFAAV